MSIPEVPTPEQGQSTEPALKVGAIVAVAGAVIAAAATFGLKLTPEQTTALMALTTILAPLISGWFTRSRVYSPASVAKLLDRAE